MAFAKKTWKDRIAEFPTRRRLTKEDNTSELVTVAREEGTLSQEGDAFSAENMNDLENRIDAEFTEVNGKLHWTVASSWSNAVANAQNEIQVIIRLSTNTQNLEYTFNIALPSKLNNKVYVRNNGYYQTASSYSIVQISYNINFCSCNIFNIAGTDYKNSAELVFLYR